MYGYEPNTIQYQEAYKLAQKRIKARMEFYGHLSSYILVNALLIGIYLFTGPIPGYYTYPWFVWTMLGWGIGLFFHFMGTFVFANFDSPQRRQRLIEEEMAKMGGYYRAAPPPPTSPIDKSNYK